MSLFDHDPFSASRMPFGDHLEELRYRLWRAVAGFAACLLLVFVIDLAGQATGTPLGIARPAFDLLTAPAERELEKFHERRVTRLRDRLLTDEGTTPACIAERAVPLRVDIRTVARETGHALGREWTLPETTEGDELFVSVPARIPPAAWALLLDEGLRLLYRPPNLKVMSAAEGMFVYFKVALLCGLLLGSPWVFYQLWAFVAAGLYPKEKRLVNVYLPVSLGLFFAGIVLCQVWVMPATVGALLGFNEWLSLEPDLRLNEWLNFALLMPLVFGLAFQTPLVMWCLDRLGVLEVAAFQRHRKAACFLLAVAAAVLTPGIDLYSMLFLWLPLVLLYEVGIWLCRLSPRCSEEYPDMLSGIE
jgi:sec-independent protein translocase protein TatC